MAKKLQVKFFSIPLCGDPDLEEELNHFLQTRQIVSFDKGLADQAWNFCITYVGTNADSTSIDVKFSREKSTEIHRGMKDYKEILTPEQFPLYLRLHNLRNNLSEEYGIQKGNIFTNDELSEMSVLRCSTLNEMKKIRGVGEKKTQKFGDLFLQVIAEYQEELANEAVLRQEERSSDDKEVFETSSEQDQEKNEA